MEVLDEINECLDSSTNGTRSYSLIEHIIHSIRYNHNLEELLLNHTKTNKQKNKEKQYLIYVRGAEQSPGLSRADLNLFKDETVPHNILLASNYISLLL